MPEEYRKGWAIYTGSSKRHPAISPARTHLQGCLFYMALLNAILWIIARSICTKCPGLGHCNMNGFPDAAVQMVFLLLKTRRQTCVGTGTPARRISRYRFGAPSVILMPNRFIMHCIFPYKT